MDTISTIKPSFSIPINTENLGDQTTFNITNRTILNGFVNNTYNFMIASSPGIVQNKNSSNNNTSGDVDNLFTWVFIACVALALLLVVSIFMVIICWSIKRRRRTATVTDVGKGGDKGRKRGRTNIRQSIKRVFVEDGPLYAVSNLSGGIRRYNCIPKKQSQNSADSSRSSVDVVISPPPVQDTPSDVPRENQHSIYQRYLSPIEGVPTPPRSVSPAPRDSDETYLQPIDELRASKRFLQHSKEEPTAEETYLEPLHGIPVPDDVHQKTSTPKPGPKPSPSPKPSTKPKH